MLTNSGEELLYPVDGSGAGLAGWSPHRGMPLYTPGAVAFDHNCGKGRAYLAGFYRGKGLPVLYVAGNDSVELVVQSRCLVAPDLDTVARWIRSGALADRTAGVRV